MRMLMMDLEMEEQFMADLADQPRANNPQANRQPAQAQSGPMFVTFVPNLPNETEDVEMTNLELPMFRTQTTEAPIEVETN